jgi:quercetin dioxygenase-like cupin family protein
LQAEPPRHAGKSELPAAEAVALAGLLHYQPGSVVSRTILSRETGTVTLFAFDETQGLSEHTAPFDALVQVLEGEVEITIDGKPLRARTGDAVLMPAHRPHALAAITRLKMLLTMIRSRPAQP